MDRASTEPVLVLDHLAVAYGVPDGEVQAVRDVSFEILQGETYGLVGESGCGKSTVAFSIVNSLGRNGRISGGSLVFQGRNLIGRSHEELRRLRGNQISMVYQDPMQALNPMLTIGAQLAEVLIYHQKMSRGAANEACLAMLKRVYMPDPELIMQRYPHQLSGGQQQRVIIAMALLNHPALLIMDEPTTALDVTVEAAVLDLIDELRREFNTAILYISHNLGVIARVCDRIGVMYLGEIVEQGDIRDVFARPVHPYTRGLLGCVPQSGAARHERTLMPIPGQVPALTEVPQGCLFGPRCQFAKSECLFLHPPLKELGAGHFARCHSFDHADLPLGQLGVEVADGAVHMVPGNQPGGSILRVENLRTYYRQEQRSVASLIGLGQKRYVKALDGISFSLPKGAALGIVGESGCGKSTLARTIMGLEAPTDGSIEFLGMDVSRPVSRRDMGVIRELQMVFQNPDSTLNPSFSVGAQIARPLRRFKKLSASRAREEVLTLLRAVKLDETYYDRLPRQLSGGQKQRVAIARAIAAHPDLVMCDEPVSALDVSVQAAILNLLLDLRHEFGITMVFISHDLGVVRYFSDYVAVMYLGRVCEIGPAEAIYSPPYHPYTEALLSAVPVPDPLIEQKRLRLTGTVPSPLNPPEGCRFHTRCPRKIGTICETNEPPCQNAGAEHSIFCHIALSDLRKIEPVVTAVRRNSSTHQQEERE